MSGRERGVSEKERGVGVEREREVEGRIRNREGE
jgi:hypothetical protein